jgi:hypothetical protein
MAQLGDPQGEKRRARQSVSRTGCLKSVPSSIAHRQRTSIAILSPAVRQRTSIAMLLPAVRQRPSIAMLSARRSPSGPVRMA